jgi:crossover junction endodeoxyribonuclease RusA
MNGTTLFNLALPYPPSANTIWRAVGGRVILSEKGRLYRCQIAFDVMSQLGRFRSISGPLALAVEVMPPDRRRRDLDNVLKATLDGLTHAKVWGDDSQVKRIEIEMHEPTKGGRLNITITSHK